MQEPQEITGELDIPDEINRFEISVQNATDQAELAEVDIDLTSTDSLPLTVLLEPSDQTPEELEVHVLAYLDAQLIARIDVVHGWQSGANNIARLPPLELIE